MKMRIMFYLVLVALFGFAGNSFAVEKTEAPSVIATPEGSDEAIRPQGTEDPTNTYMGMWAGYSNTTGEYNSYFGAYAGHNNTTGYTNSFFGYAAGYNNTSGYDNSFFGHFTV